MPEHKKGPLTLADVRAYRAEILALIGKYHASNIRVFGSVARGEASLESDVDFLVDFAPNYSLLDHAGLLVDLRDLLNCPVDVVNAPFLREEYREFVICEAVAL